ncbi:MULTISPECIES: hypothetical protein [Pseudomonas]|uniref:hypothetical protein n=1 Tax=Pseudomonas TaxID=286 RepID=UPI00123B5BD0|nr:MULTISPECIES: hypothetical protein [Pseudomonas]QIB50074.1 hypothetical protein G3M63_02750 [Pseudomonas sp. OIL-1]
MPTLATISKNKPAWIANEGHWRMLQVLRFFLSGAVALVGFGLLVAFALDHRDYSYLIVAAFFFGTAVTTHWGIYAAAWALCWVREGFSQTKENP